MMRAIWILPFTALCLCVGTAEAQEVRPYTASVAADDAPIHSGPGRNYYVTGRLRRGAEVEVYRHDADGWLAIRPPDGSFSLVGSRYLRPGTGGVATVLEDQVGARVGSLESPDRDVVQVRLTRGEEVELLEPAPVKSPNSRQTWYMISPPAGEFRWIHESRIVGGRTAEDAAAPRRLPNHDNERPLHADQSSRDEGLEEESYEDSSPRGTKLATFQIDRNRAPARQSTEETDDEGWTSRDRPAAPIEPAAVERQREPRERPIDAEVPPTEPVTRAGSLRAELDSIELALSQMVAQDSSRWDFTQINRRAERLLDQSATAVERGRSRLLLRKIARFEDIAQGYADVRKSGMRSRPIAPQNAPEFAPAEPAPPVATTRPRSSFRDEQRASDQVGVGRLTQVMSRRPGAPLFALVDENRQVRYFVTPSAGINLRSYVGKQVEISGLATYNRDFSKQLLTAERVDILSDSVLRR